MSLAYRGVSIWVLAVAMFSGCAATESAKKTELPPPATSTADGTLTLDVPAAFAEQVKIPAQVNAKIHISFESKAIQADPIRSHFDGKVTFVVTDPQRTRQYLDFAATLSGDFDGPPNEGFFRAAGQASGLIGLFYKGLERPEAEPKAH